MTARRIGALVALGVAACVLALLFWVDLSDLLSPSRLETGLRDAGPLGPLLVVGLMTLAVVASPLPSLPIDLAAGAAFGGFLGGVYALLGATLGAAISFGLARALGRETIAGLVGGHLIRCPACSDHTLMWLVMGSRLIPAVSFDLVSYGAGLTGMSFGRFLIATVVGSAPLTFLYTSLGPSFASDDPKAWILGGALVLALIALPALLERRGWIEPARWHSPPRDPV